MYLAIWLYIVVWYDWLYVCIYDLNSWLAPWNGTYVDDLHNVKVYRVGRNFHGLYVKVMWYPAYVWWRYSNGRTTRRWANGRDRGLQGGRGVERRWERELGRATKRRVMVTTNRLLRDRLMFSLVLERTSVFVWVGRCERANKWVRESVNEWVFE